MYVYIKIHTMQAYMYSYYEYTLIDDIPTKENKTEGNLTLQIWIFCQELLDKFRLEKKIRYTHFYVCNRVYTCHVSSGAYRGKNSASDPPELELQIDFAWLLGTEFASGKTLSIINVWVISSALK